MDGLAELHTHLGGSVSSDILWTLAHEQGIALPVKDYWDFDRLVTVSDPRGVPNLDAIRGLDRASLEYPQVQAGLILMMDRTFSARQNEVIVEKSIRWASRGIVGIDIAGPRPRGERPGPRSPAPGPDRSRHPRGRRRGPDAGAPRRRGRPRDLPDLEPPHEGASGRVRRT